MLPNIAMLPFMVRSLPRRSRSRGPLAAEPVSCISRRQQVVDFDSKNGNRVFTLNCCVSEGKVIDLSVALLAETDCLTFINGFL